jgi:hypothetical protein
MNPCKISDLKDGHREITVDNTFWIGGVPNIMNVIISADKSNDVCQLALKVVRRVTQRNAITIAQTNHVTTSPSAE